MAYKPQIELLQYSQNPAKLVASVATQTMHKDTQLVNNPDKLCERLYMSKHLSVFEHVYLTLRLTNVSRSFMAEVTRHRHLSFTCSSQHYQNYSDYDFCCPAICKEYCEDTLAAYNTLIENDLPVWEARQVLPNAIAVNMVITGNARAWMEFLPKRLCARNIPEMIIAAKKIHTTLKAWFPVFHKVGPSCEEAGICFEGKKLSCGKCEDVR